MTIGVVVVDAQSLVRTGIRRLLEAQHDLSVVGEATDGVHAIAVVERCQP